MFYGINIGINFYLFKHPIWEEFEPGGTETHISHNPGKHLSLLDQLKSNSDGMDLVV